MGKDKVESMRQSSNEMKSDLLSYCCFADEDLIKYAWPQDVWFHVDKLSSAHVYLRMPESMSWESIPESLLIDCAQLVKANSIEGVCTFTTDLLWPVMCNHTVALQETRKITSQSYTHLQRTLRYGMSCPEYLLCHKVSCIENRRYGCRPSVVPQRQAGKPCVSKLLSVLSD